MKSLSVGKKLWRTVLFCLTLSACAAVPAAAGQLIIPSYVGASSTLTGGNYSPWNIQDYNCETAWVEGVAGNGIGEYLTMQVPEGAVLTGGVIFTGYQKTEDLFYKNSAPTRLRFSTGGSETYVELYDVANYYYGNAGSGYTFFFDQPLYSDGYLMVEILDVRAGWLYEDTCISELRLTGVMPGSDSGYPSPDQEEEFDTQTLGMLSGIAQCIYRTVVDFNNFYDNTEVDVWDLDDMQQAFLLYWYQYNVSDSRIYQNIDFRGETGYNAAYVSDMEDILEEIFAEAAGSAAFDAFCSHYVEGREGELLYMNGVGDFGDAGMFYFSYPTYVMKDQTYDGEKTVTVIGTVMEWNQYAGSYTQTSEYKAVFSIEEPDQFSVKRTFSFDKLYTGLGG